MRIKFSKYQGTGNDFIMIDGRTLTKKLSLEKIRKLCHRRFGIGADGLIIVLPHPSYDFEMDYYNADGSQSFCGNGSRCAQAFAKQLGMIGEKSKFLAIDGVHFGESRGEKFATKMGDVLHIDRRGQDYLIHTGSPHYIRYIEEDVDHIDVYTLGTSIRYNEEFKKEGVNVNFVSEEKGNIKVRTYERGVENETYSCGTGVTAVAISFAEKNAQNSHSCLLQTKGGDLRVEYRREKTGSYKDIWLIGPAELVFYGEVSLD